MTKKTYRIAETIYELTACLYSDKEHFDKCQDTSVIRPYIIQLAETLDDRLNNEARENGFETAKQYLEQLMEYDSVSYYDIVQELYDNNKWTIIGEPEPVELKAGQVWLCKSTAIVTVITAVQTHILDYTAIARGKLSKYSVLHSEFRKLDMELVYG